MQGAIYLSFNFSNFFNSVSLLWCNQCIDRVPLTRKKYRRFTPPAQPPLINFFHRKRGVLSLAPFERGIVLDLLPWRRGLARRAATGDGEERASRSLGVCAAERADYCCETLHGLIVDTMTRVINGLIPARHTQCAKIANIPDIRIPRPHNASFRPACPPPRFQTMSPLFCMKFTGQSLRSCPWSAYSFRIVCVSE